MTPLVAIIAPGAMGSAVARRLHDHGVQVLTALDGRSTESVKRAEAAGMVAVERPELVRAGMFLSIVPPGEAVSLAENIATQFVPSSKKPVYVDCNAINPGTAARVAAIVHDAGMHYVDGGIIGGPPKPGYDGPVFYLSGAQAGEVLVLRDFGLDCRLLDRGPWSASALKMSYAGITKGLTALGSMMILGAARAGVADELHAELANSQPMLLAWFERQIPSMFPKAHRWIVEMEEIATFLQQEPEAESLFRTIAEFYTRVASDTGSAKATLLSGFFDAAKDSQ